MTAADYLIHLTLSVVLIVGGSETAAVPGRQSHAALGWVAFQAMGPGR